MRLNIDLGHHGQAMPLSFLVRTVYKHMCNPMKIFITIIFALTITGIVGCKSYPYPVSTSGSVLVANDNMSIKVVFSDHDRRLIHQYYDNGKRKKLPPGLAKKKHLPPGLQKQIRRNGSLPPGLEGGNLPYELERNLASLSGGYLRVRVGADIVLMDAQTRIILDVIKDVPF
jgi:hypothetical protein